MPTELEEISGIGPTTAKKLQRIAMKSAETLTSPYGNNLKAINWI